MKKEYLLIVAIVLLASFLRLYKLDSFPIGLYSDETSLGYNAYSILKTQADEFGARWPITIKSFGDYKPPMSAWLNIPSIFLLGLNEFAVRLPSAIAGIITVLVVYFLSREIFSEDLKRVKIFKYLPHITAFLIAVSPWSLLFSRSNMLVGIEIMFTSAGFLFFLKGFKKSNYFILSSICFSAAIYSYYGARITILLLFILSVFLYHRELYSRKKSLILPVIIGFILLFPLTLSIVKDTQTLIGRASTISIFYDQDIQLKLWEAHTLDGPTYPVILSRFFNNKIYLYSTDVVKRYLQHFSLDFLTVKGDGQTPFTLHGMGVVYIQEVLFFLIGLYYLVKNRTKKIMAVFSYLLVSPIASSFTFMTPAANRSFNMVIGWSIITAVGILVTVNYLATKRLYKLGLCFISFVYILSFAYFIYIYFYILPEKYPNQWHYGRKQLVEKVSSLEDKYEKVIISASSGPVYIWFLFYKQYDPADFRRTAQVSDQPNQYGFIDVKSFAKYRFVKPFIWENIEKSPNILYVSFEDDIPDLWSTTQNGKILTTYVIDNVSYPNDKPAFKLVELRAL